MGCWEVVDIDTLPNDANLIGVKWVFKLKYKNSEYELHKARIVALGYQQCKNVDYFASFSPTASYVMIDRPFIVLTETKFCKRHIPVWARYSPLRTRVEAHANTLSP